MLAVAVVYASMFLVFGVPPNISLEAWPYLLIPVLLATAPFGLLARAGIRDRVPWIVAGILTACVWGAYFVSVLIAARDRTGANIGIGLLLLVSPLVIAGGAFIAAKFTRTRS